MQKFLRLSGLLQVDLQLSGIDCGSVGVTEKMAETTQRVQQKKRIFGQQGRRTPDTGCVMRCKSAECQRDRSEIWFSKWVAIRRKRSSMALYAL